MKIINTLLIAIFMLAGFGVNAQVAVNTDGSSADGSAMLDVKSTDKGFLPPRMTGGERDAISNPVAGLTVWCTNCGDNGEMQVYNGTAWTNMVGGEAATVPLAVGDSYQGGIIAYILQPGDPGYAEGETHGLIAAVSDQSTGAEWGCYNTEINGADGTAIGTGEQNTADILSGCTTSGIAAKLCADYSNGGYDDWYLPSIDELAKLYDNRVAIGNFSNGKYWSSSEDSATNAWFFVFSSGTTSSFSKPNTFYVRAVRAF